MSMSPVTKTGWIGLVSSTLILISGAAMPSAAAVDALGQGTPFADGTVDAGALKVATCSACHGPNGNSTTALWPKIAGQNAVYIAEQLQLFKSGVRVNPDMLKMVSTLSDKDIDSVAVYFQAQTPVGGEADPKMWQAGENLYRFGDPARDIPACTACHGPVGRGNTVADYPALRAQFADYVAKQLTDFASGARYSGAKAGAPTSRNGYMMTTIAKRLNADDVKELAAYIQGMR
jgi:cytochrome c553